MEPESVVRSLWVAWLISWFAASAWSDRTVKRPAIAREIVYRLLSVVGAILLFGQYPHGYVVEPLLWQVGAELGWGLVALALVGLLFAWWARIYLGRLWSSTVTRKADHHIVDTGPYALVRHPIYTGIILSTLATAVIRGRLSALLGVTLITLGLYLKARLEEHFLREQLRDENYDAYARRVPMLVPRVRV